MKDELFDRLNNYVKSVENEHRYKHTLGVVDTAVELAKRYGADEYKAKIAAIFHDACKSEGPIEHGPAAAKLIKSKFGVEDKDILNAIKYHTVGRANMSILERVIKCADLTEPSRDYPSVEHFRKMLRECDDINVPFLEMMLESKQVVEDSGRQYEKTSLECIAWLEEQIAERK